MATFLPPPSIARTGPRIHEAGTGEGGGKSKDVTRSAKRNREVGWLFLTLSALLVLMKINGTQTFPAPRQKVWEFLIDPQRLARCLPGCEKLEAVGEHEYASQMNVGLAAVKGVYTGKVKLEELQPPHTTKC